MNQNIKQKIYNILEQFISEMKTLNNDTMFNIENNLDTFTYQVTKQDHLITIKKIEQNLLDLNNSIIYDNINHTVLALLYMHSDIMQLFLEHNAANYKNIPNSNVYINSGLHLVIDHIQHCYYIFPSNMIDNIKANHQEIYLLLQTQEKKKEIITLFDKRNFTFQNMMMVLTLCSTIIVPIVIAQMTKKST